jgi:hypothetical protein
MKITNRKKIITMYRAKLETAAMFHLMTEFITENKESILQITKKERVLISQELRTV